MKTFKDFLEWYNNLDVLPFIEAVEKMKTFYKAKKLDLFKDGVSLPGLVLKYLLGLAQQHRWRTGADGHRGSSQAES